MPEGHTIHRLAAALTELFAGRRLSVSSPQGRFAAGAAHLDGQVLLGAEAHGKQLFVAFGPEPDLASANPAVAWLRIHLGLYGSWTFDGDAEFTAPHSIGAPRRRVGETERELPGPGQLGGRSGGSALHGLGGRTPSDPAGAGEQAGRGWSAPEPRGAVRLRLLGDHGVADLTGPTACEVLDASGKARVEARLGPDPLRADGRRQEFVTRVRARRRSVGELLMDQSVLAGVGNIYRAEVLFRAGIPPRRRGDRVSAARLERVWDDLVALMGEGVATGLITTVEEEDVPVPLPEGDAEAGRWYVYHRTGRPCLRCGTPVAEADMAGRRLFWCPTCQAR